MTIDKTQLINNMNLSGYSSEVNIRLEGRSEDELNLISNFAPMIASKSLRGFSDTYNLEGKRIFDELMNLMALNKEELTRINKNYNACKWGDKQCYYQIIQQIRDAIEQIKAAYEEIRKAYKEKLINDMGLSKYSDTIFSQINNLSEKELNLISNFAPIIASMDSNTGKDIFDKLIALNKEKLELILNLAPIIASMDSNTGKDIFGKLMALNKKDIFGKLMALNKQQLSEINTNYNEYKNKIIEQIIDSNMMNRMR